jgi:hypothetical protein
MFLVYARLEIDSRGSPTEVPYQTPTRTPTNPPTRRNKCPHQPQSGLQAREETWGVRVPNGRLYLPRGSNQADRTGVCKLSQGTHTSTLRCMDGNLISVVPQDDIWHGNTYTQSRQAGGSFSVGMVSAHSNPEGK